MIKTFGVNKFICDECAATSTGNLEEIHDEAGMPQIEHPPGWATLGTETGDKIYCPTCIAMKFQWSKWLWQSVRS